MSNYEEALKKIEEAKVTRATKLDLSHMELKELPPEIGQLKKLRWLDLYNNQLTGMPREIGELKNLKRLWLGKNPIDPDDKSIAELRGNGISVYI